MKLFEITYGREAVRGFVKAESFDELNAYMDMLGWPENSQVGEVQAVELADLPAYMEAAKARIKGELCVDWNPIWEKRGYRMLAAADGALTVLAPGGKQIGENLRSLLQVFMACRRHYDCEQSKCRGDFGPMAMLDSLGDI